MILFVTGQYAGAQYIHPLLERWSKIDSPNWQLVATGTSCKYWDEKGISYYDFCESSSESVPHLLDLVKPSLVVVSTSASIILEYVFIIEAMKKKIPTASYIDIWNNYRDRFQYDRETIFPDYVLAIDDRCASEMIAEGIPEDIVKVIGQPYLENVVLEMPAIGNHLLITSQPIRKYRKHSLGYDETIFCDVCIKAVEQLNIDQVYISRHPDEQTVLEKKNIKGVIWTVGKGVDDVASSHTVLGMYSMQMIIAYLWGRKVASIQPGLCGVDPSPLSRWGLIPKLDDVEDVVSFISKPKNNIQNIDLKENLLGSTERIEKFCLAVL